MRFSTSDGNGYLKPQDSDNKRVAFQNELYCEVGSLKTVIQELVKKTELYFQTLHSSHSDLSEMSKSSNTASKDTVR